MAKTTTTRLGITRWSAGSDTFVRTDMDDSHAALETRVGTFYSGEGLPTGLDPTQAEYERAFYLDETSKALYVCDGTAWVLVGNPSTNPGPITPGDTASAGSSTALARADHRHATPAWGVVGELTQVQTSATSAGTTDKFARIDHQHAIADDAVTNAKIRNSTGLSVIGNASTSTGDPGDITAASDGLVLRRSGSSLGFGQITSLGIENNAVTEDKIVANAVTLNKISLASNPTVDTQAARKAYVDLKGQQAILNAQAAAPTVGTVVTSGPTIIATTTITDPGYNIFVWGHGSVAFFTETMSTTWSVWSLLMYVDGSLIDRLDVPVNLFMQGYAGLSIGVPLRRTPKTTGSNCVITMRVQRAVGDGNFVIGGSGTTNNLQVYWTRQ